MSPLPFRGNQSSPPQIDPTGAVAMARPVARWIATGWWEHVTRGNLSRLSAASAGLVGIGLVAAVDWRTGTEISFSIFYLLPVALSVWFGGLQVGLGVALSGAVVWFLLDGLGEPRPSHTLIPYWNGFVRFGFFALTALLLDAVRQIASHLNDLVNQRTAALKEEIAQRQQVEREIAELSQREQERLSCELHDHLGGSLAGMAFQAKALSEKLDRRGLADANDARHLVTLANLASGEVRRFARLLAPLEGAGGDLVLAMNQLGTNLRELFDVSCRVHADGRQNDLHGEQCHQLYRIVQEAARNAIQHGGARTIDVRILNDGEELTLTVRHDGAPVPATSDRARGLGMNIMRYRVGLLGGSLDFATDAGGLATLICRVPLAIAG